MKHLGIDKFEWLKRMNPAPMKPTERRVLLQIFNYTNKEGCHAHPGNRRLADDLGIDIRDVRRALQGLEGQHWLIPQQRGGNEVRKGYATVYGLGPGPDFQAASEELRAKRDAMMKEGESSPPSEEEESWPKEGEFPTKEGEFPPLRRGSFPLPTDHVPDHASDQSYTPASTDAGQDAPWLQGADAATAPYEATKAEQADPVSPAWYHSRERQMAIDLIRQCGWYSGADRDENDVAKYNDAEAHLVGLLEESLGSEEFGMVCDYWTFSQAHTAPFKAATKLNQLINAVKTEHPDGIAYTPQRSTV